MTAFTFIDAQTLASAEAYKLVLGCVVPRPIAWITTIDENGCVNAAPFSSYNYVATEPPMLAVNIAGRPDVLKDTERNIRASGEFVVNVATEVNMALMHASAAEYPAGTSEAEVLGIALLPSRLVRPPRIAVSPVQMECRLDQIVTLGGGHNQLFIGQVLAFHLSDDIYDGQRIDSVKMRPLSRLGGPFYAGLGEIFHRPMLQRTPEGDAAPVV